jgi:hypothetical protein
MRRIRFYTLNALAVLSVLLFAATVWFWVRSRDESDELALERTTQYSVISFERTIRFRHYWETAQPVVEVIGLAPRTPPRVVPYSDHTVIRLQFDANPYCVESQRWSFLGIWCGHEEPCVIHSTGSYQYQRPGTTLAVPHWMLALLAALLPARQAAQLFGRRRTRSQAGLCHRCGYDLRATPDRCPECGMTPTKANA